MASRGRSSRSGKGEAGAIAVELLIILPILLGLLFGIVNFGVILGQQLALNNSVRQGARAAVVEGGSGQDCPGITANVRGDLSAPGIATSAVNVSVTRSDGTNPCALARVCDGSYDVTDPAADREIASLSVRADYNSALWILNTTIDLEAQAVYQCEYR